MIGRNVAPWCARWPTPPGSAPATAPYGTNALRYVGFAKELVVFGPGSIDDAHKARECVVISQIRMLRRRLRGLATPGLKRRRAGRTFR